MAVISKSKIHGSDHDLIARKKWTLSNLANGCLFIISALFIVITALLMFGIAEYDHLDKTQPAGMFMSFCIFIILSRQFLMEKILISKDAVTVYTVSPKMKNAEVIDYENIVITDVPDHGELLELILYKDNEIVGRFLVMI